VSDLARAPQRRRASRCAAKLSLSLALTGLTLLALPAPAAEIALGPSWLRTHGDEVIGGALSATWRGAERLAYIVEASAHVGDTQGENLREIALLAGAHLSPWPAKRLRPFVALKLGVVAARRQVSIFGTAVGRDGVCDGGCPSDFGPSGEAGAGVDLRLTQRIVLRVPEAEYRMSRIAGAWERGLRVSASVVARW
jgi:hypothetical protein